MKRPNLAGDIIRSRRLGDGKWIVMAVLTHKLICRKWTDGCIGWSNSAEKWLYLKDNQSIKPLQSLNLSGGHINDLIPYMMANPTRRDA